LALEAFQTAYTSKMQQLLTLLQANLTEVFPKADTKEYEKKVAQLETAITSNLQKIAEKVKEPAKTVALKDTDTLVTEIDTLIDTINTQTQTNNDIVATKHDIWKILPRCRSRLLISRSVLSSCLTGRRGQH
ncbi:MAG: AAA family ATPase, partial [Eubacterium sp.]|nr:AAA family ATPase [Eubacterium sp.]